MRARDRLFQSVRLQLLKANELQSRRMRGLEVHRCSDIMFECVFPSGDANTPLVAGFEPGKTPFRMRRDEVVSIKDGKVQELARCLHANGMQADVFRPGATITIAVKPRDRITATAFQFGSKNIRRHYLA